MRLVITGGAGFLGSHLCNNLITQGHTVICVDNLLTGSQTNIQHLMASPNFSFLKQDVSEKLEIEGGVDYILHFASPASPVDYYEFPIETMKVGSLGTFNCLDLALEKGARFLLASTSEVYGDPQINPQHEDYWGYVNPVGPRSVYDEANRFAEALTMAYERRFGQPFKIARIFNTYGPGMQKDDGRVIPNFITQALRDEPLTVYGDGSQTRSFCYVSDLISGIVKLIFSDVTGPVNLGSPQEMTVLELARKVLEVTASQSKIVFKALPQDDPKQRRPDIRRARRLLGWEPEVSLDEGLKATVVYFKSLAK